MSFFTARRSTRREHRNGRLDDRLDDGIFDIACCRVELVGKFSSLRARRRGYGGRGWQEQVELDEGYAPGTLSDNSASLLFADIACRGVELDVEFSSLQPRRRGSGGRGWLERVEPDLGYAPVASPDDSAIIFYFPGRIVGRFDRVVVRRRERFFSAAGRSPRRRDRNGVWRRWHRRYRLPRSRARRRVFVTPAIVGGVLGSADGRNTKSCLKFCFRTVRPGCAHRPISPTTELGPQANFHCSSLFGGVLGGVDGRNA